MLQVEWLDGEGAHHVVRVTHPQCRAVERHAQQFVRVEVEARRVLTAKGSALQDYIIAQTSPRYYYILLHYQLISTFVM